MVYLVKVVGFIDRYKLYYTGPIDTSPVIEGVVMINLVPRVSHLTAPSERGETLGAYHLSE